MKRTEDRFGRGGGGAARALRENPQRPPPVLTTRIFHLRVPSHFSFFHVTMYTVRGRARCAAYGRRETDREGEGDATGDFCVLFFVFIFVTYRES